MVSVLLSPGSAGLGWAAALHYSSAGDSHKLVQSKGNSVDDRNNLNVKDLNKYTDFSKVGRILYFTPDACEVEEIHKMDTETVETSKKIV